MNKSKNHLRYKFPFTTEEVANLATEIVAEAGIRLTLRQIFYQLEQKHRLIPAQFQTIDNIKDKAYKILSDRLTKARLMGLFNWDDMIDESRRIEVVSSWTSPEDYMTTVKRAYKRDYQQSQPVRVEVWCEKTVAVNAITQKYRIPLVAGGGYRGKSNLYEAAQRFQDDGRPIKILYLGDFDPSGMDIERDLTTAFFDIWGLEVTVERVLLTREDTLKLPSKGLANKKDPRFGKYVAKWGTDQAWELDALPPKELLSRTEAAIQKSIDMELFAEEVERGKADIEKIAALTKNL